MHSKGKRDFELYKRVSLLLDSIYIYMSDIILIFPNYLNFFCNYLFEKLYVMEEVKIGFLFKKNIGFYLNNTNWFPYDVNIFSTI